MMDKLKQLGDMKKKMKELEEAYEQISVSVSGKFCTITGNVNEIKEIIYDAKYEYDNEKCKKDMIETINKYFKKAESEKQKATIAKMGGMSGMLNALKG